MTPDIWETVTVWCVVSARRILRPLRLPRLYPISSYPVIENSPGSESQISTKSTRWYWQEGQCLRWATLPQIKLSSFILKFKNCTLNYTNCKFYPFKFLSNIFHPYHHPHRLGSMSHFEKAQLIQIINWWTNQFF